MALSSGLSLLLRKIEDDECQASDPIVKMSSSYENHQDFDANDTYFLMIPGFQEDPGMFKVIAETIKMEAVTLQLGPDCEGNSIPQMAEHLWHHIKKGLNFQNEFHILGYSFGVNIALELAALMEEEGNIGVVYCVDSSPDALRVQLDACIGRATVREIQNIVISQIYHIISGETSADLHEDLNKIDCWNQKIDACIQRLKSFTTHSHQYLKDTIKTVYKKILLAREYEPNFKLESELVLLKAPPIPTLDMDNLAKDYNLSKYTKQRVKIYDIKSDHFSSLEDVRVPNIINTLLEPELVDSYLFIYLFI